MRLVVASMVRISRGRIPSLSKLSTAAPASKQSRILSSEMAFWDELFGRDMPSASMALPMVLAVYIPPQEPAPGMALDSTVSSSSSENSPLACLPTASNTETISKSLVSPLMLAQPGRIVPPYTNRPVDSCGPWPSGSPACFCHTRRWAQSRVTREDYVC